MFTPKIHLHLPCIAEITCFLYMFQMNHDQVDSLGQDFIPRSPLSISNQSPQVVAEQSAKHLDISCFPSTEENDLDKACHVQWIRAWLVLDLRSQKQRMIQNIMLRIVFISFSNPMSNARGESCLWLMCNKRKVCLILGAGVAQWLGCAIAG